MGSDERGAAKYLDCPECLKQVPLEHRAIMCCEYIPVEKRRPDGLRVIGDVDLNAIKSCPVALSKRPFVQECAFAWQAFNKGELSTYYPRPSQKLLEGVYVLERARAIHEAQQAQELKNRIPK